MHNSYFGLRETALSEEDLFRHGQELAAQSVSRGVRGDFPHLSQDEKRLTAAYGRLSLPSSGDEEAARWLVDHFHLLEQTIKELESRWQQIRFVMRMTEGPSAGLPRIYRIAVDLVGKREGRVDAGLIEKYLCAYQKESALSMEELWTTQLALQTALVKLCTLEAVECLRRSARRKQAQITAQRLEKLTEEEAEAFLKRQPLEAPEYVERLTVLLRDRKERSLLNRLLAERDTDSLRMAQGAHRAQLKSCILLENAIGSLKRMEDIDWEALFRAVSRVDQELSLDPVYRLMDAASRQYYRDCVRALSEKTGVGEPAVARAALGLARREGQDARRGHVGWYLAERGVSELLRQLRSRREGSRISWRGKGAGAGWYLAAVAAGTALLLLLAFWAGFAACDTVGGVVTLALALLPAAVCAWSVWQSFLWRGLSCLPVRRVPRLALDEGIPDRCRTLVTVPVLAGSPQKARELVRGLLVHYYACRGERNICYCLLCDLPAAETAETEEDAAILRAAQEEADDLNRAYANGEPLFFVLFRRRRENAEGKFCGWERKRGALSELNSLLLGGGEGSFYDGPKPMAIAYVLTLDGDTRLPMGAAKKLIGSLAHPLNGPELLPDGTVQGHAVIVPRMETTARSAQQTRFSRLFSREAGLDSYSSVVSEVYQDLFGEGNYGGKGIYDVRAFEGALAGKIAENTVLSHDLLEGSYARAAYASDIVLYDDHPARYLSWAMRLHRWMRGDWQLLPYGLEGRGLSAICRYKLFDNLRRSLLAPSAALLLLFSPLIPGGWAFSLLALLALLWGSLAEFLRGLFRTTDLQLLVKDSLSGLWDVLWRAVFMLCTLPYEGMLSLDAAFRALWRTFVSHQHMLEWTTAAEAERRTEGAVAGHYRTMLIAPVAGTAAAVLGMLHGAWPALFLGLLWGAAPYAAARLSRPVPTTRPGEEDEALFWGLARSYWKFFADTMTEKRHGLPPDNLQLEPRRPAAERTSPTNIAMGLLAPFAAWKLDLAGKEETLFRTEKITETLERMEKWHGHLYNWYDTLSLSPMIPRFVSTVDSGNLVAAMITARELLDQMEDPQAKTLRERINRLIVETDFAALFDRERKLFFVGYDEQNSRMSGAHYDLLASEARLTSLCAIALGQVDSAHWFRLARPLTAVEGKRLLISWSGTMFEYLMPVLLTGTVKGTLLEESVRGILAAQKGFAKGQPWGVSESGYYAFDLHMNYQYRAFGVPGAGVKPAREDRVVAPYASVMAAMVEPAAAAHNLRRLRELGVEGNYGFYEAVDYTPKRVGKGCQVVRSYMAHHQGMSLLALANLLTDGAMIRAFLGAPEIDAASLLLEERLPDRSIVLKEYDRAFPQPVLPPFGEVRVHHRVPAGAPPEVCVLSGGIRILAFSDGRSAAFWRDLALYRPETDRVRGEPSAGMYVAVRGGKSGIVGGGEACFEADRAIFTRLEDGIFCRMELCAPPEEPTELRLLTVTNQGDHTAEVAVYGYGEICLASEADWNAHPAFQKLFVSAERLDGRTVRFTRRNREGKAPLQLCARWIGRVPPQMGTNRFEALGRLQNGWQPRFLTEGTGKFEKVPLDPCILFEETVRLAPGESAEFAMVFCAGMEKDRPEETVRQYETLESCKQMAALCGTFAQVRLHYLGVDSELAGKLRTALGQILSPLPPDSARLEALRHNGMGREGLWRLGISGDGPVVLMILSQERELPAAREVLRLAQYGLLCGCRFDTVLIDDEPAGYERPVWEMLEQWSAGVNGVHLLCGHQVSQEERTLLRAFAVLEADRRGLPSGRPLPPMPKKTPVRHTDALSLSLPALEHWNGWGGFDGEEYVLRQRGEPTPLPWSNVLAEEGFGALVTESGLGYTYAQNSALCKLTPLANDPVADRSGELLFLRDEESGAVWSPLPAPMPAGESVVRHGFGYTRYRSGGEALLAETDVLADGGVKLCALSLYNPMDRPRRLSVYFCAEWVLGENRAQTQLLWAGREGELLLAKKGGVQGVAFASVVGREFTDTCSRAEFFGAGREGEIRALSGVELSSSPGGGADSCAAMRVPVALAPGERQEILFLLGWAQNEAQARKMAQRYAGRGAAKEALARVQNRWNNRLSRLRVKTQDRAFDRMMNGWLLYQVYSSRLLARAGYYQAGGAYGFRDQLQDTLALLEVDPMRTREQLLLCAAHQFEEGDVQHWWHPPAEGVRTRISDDLLFLPYVALAYEQATGDESIWEEEVPFLRLPPVPPEKKDLYAKAETGQSSSFFDHCLRAVERVLAMRGEHGLPLMGSGDWNDGMDQVGEEGKGESVWLAWFLLKVLEGFAPLCRRRGQEEKALFLESGEKALRAAVEREGWDGQWYRRAFFDDGTPLGSIQNSECSIDVISQAWSVLAGGAEKRARTALASAEKRLVDRKNGMIRLLDPPFSKQLPWAGYIQGYLPGIRENGGQYTHGAVWLILACAELGEKERAAELWSMICPIRHSDNPIIAAVYQAEPYVMAGDVYGGSHPGRAGWTWYTGAAAWMYRAGLRLLGFEKKGDQIELKDPAPQLGECVVRYDDGSGEREWRAGGEK